MIAVIQVYVENSTTFVKHNFAFSFLFKRRGAEEDRRYPQLATSEQPIVDSLLVIAQFITAGAAFQTGSTQR